MQFRITGQRSAGLGGAYPNEFINFIEIDHVVEASDEYDALEQVANDGAELYLCRDLEIQPLYQGSTAIFSAVVNTSASFSRTTTTSSRRTPPQAGR